MLCVLRGHTGRVGLPARGGSLASAAYSLGAAATGAKKRSSSKGAGSGSVARSRRNSSRRNDGARDRNVGKG